MGGRWEKRRGWAAAGNVKDGGFGGFEIELVAKGVAPAFDGADGALGSAGSVVEAEAVVHKL